MKNSSPFKNPIGDKLGRLEFLAAVGVLVAALPGAVLADCAPCGDLNQIPTPNPWFIRGPCYSYVCDYNYSNNIGVHIPVTGVRRYCGLNYHPLGETWPCRPDSANVCITIYPNVADITNGLWDDALTNFMRDALPRDMLSCWHELAGGDKSDQSGHLISAQDAVAMQNYILNFRKTRFPNTAVAIGAIECGNGASGGGWTRCQPYMAPGLDFYGFDLYHKNYADPVAALDFWCEQVVTNHYGAPGATIAVCECNCEKESDRPSYFQKTANWLWNQPNKGTTCFLTFWNPTGTMSGPWDPNDSNTIYELYLIGSGNYRSGLVASAGPNQILYANARGTATLTLDGSGSTDLGGTITSYVWRANGTVLASGVNPVVTLPISTNLIVLTLTDNQGQTANDQTTVQVRVPLTTTYPTNAYAASILAYGPVGYWPLQETYAPAAATMETNYGSLGALGNAYYAISSADQASVVFGQDGALAGTANTDQAVAFAGPSGRNYAFVPHLSAALTLHPPLTMECWLNSTSTAFGDLLGQGGAGENSSTWGGIRLS
jgi:hypothetical protein